MYMTQRNLFRKVVMVCLMLVILCAFPVWGAQQDAASEADALLEQMTVREKIGQMVMADFRTWNENPEDENSEAVPVTELREEIRDAISRDRFGGIILFAENCPENEQTQQLISEMQTANLDTDSSVQIPLMIAIDQEGGRVTRLGQATRFMGNMAIAATGDPGNAAAVAQHIGEELSLLGFNTDFAPVLDVNNNPANPVIGTRSFSDDPDMVAEYGLSFLSGLKETGTITSLKHFPGHGDVATDSHTGFPVLRKTYDELKECELVPFRAAIEAGADMVMTAHIQYPEIETQTYTSISTGEEVYIPATLSRTILTDILRGDMGFDGVIVSDALNMAAISENFDLKDIGKMAIEAGVDMFLMPVPVTDAETLQTLDEWMDNLAAQVENGEIGEEIVDASVRRILTLKLEHGLLGDFDPEPDEKQIQEMEEKVGGTENHALEWEILQKGVTLLKNDGGMLPIEAKEGEKVLVLYSSDDRMAGAEFARLRLVEEGLMPESVSVEAMAYVPENEDACLAAAAEADYVMAVSVVSSLDEMNPETEKGQKSAVLDRVIDAVHDGGKQVLLISANLPYDAARYEEADAILVSYSSSPMPELPEGKSTYSANIPAAICGAFGEYSFSGILPVNIPKMGEDYTFTEEMLYERGSH